VALAATLALGNEVLILDEPTSELDEHATQRIVEILKDLKSRGRTILLIEHKFSHFRDIVDKLVIMEGGEISTSGNPENILEDERIRKIIVPDFSGIKPSTKNPEFWKENPRSTAVSVTDLSYSYGDFPALKDINLTIYSGEFVAIVGENGSGKTTLVKQFNNLLTPTKGDVIIAGKNTKECTITDLARKVGLVFQNPDHMFFADTVREEVAFGLRNIGARDDETVIDAALENAGLSHTKELYPRWLSRGERQRLAIACVVAMQPEIIVLDEPTTGLDGNEAMQVIGLLKDLQQKGHTVIIITHNRDIAEHCSDRIIRMEKGEITEDLSAGVS
jgi:energy-coupling factor transport system ATP-binding protein